MTFYQPGGSIVRSLPSDERVETYFNEFVRHHLQVLDSTLVLNLPIWMSNLGENMAKIREGVFLHDFPHPADGPTIIVGGGPSIWKRKHLDLLVEAYETREKCNGVIMSTDRMLIPCLEREIYPEFVLSADGAPEIHQFFDSPLIEKATKYTRAIFATTLHPSVVNAWGGEILWYNTIFDDPKDLMGLTRAVHYLTGGEGKALTLDTLGNVGSGCFTASLQWKRGIHKKKPTAFIGMDMSFEGDDPKKTEEWDRYLKLKMDGMMKTPEQYFKVVKNTTHGTSHVVPFVFEMYRVTLLNIIRGLKPKGHVWNCSEQGVLFSEEVKAMPFARYLNKFWK